MFIKITGFLVLLILVCIPLFLHIDSLPFRLWDESRVAANAYEMHKNGDLIVTYYNGEPEMWSTKPPLVIWMQLVFIKLLGFGELAVRLPSAITGLFTCAVSFFFSWRYFRNFFVGAFACLVLVTTNGYIDTHAIRTGDYDGPLALFTTLFILSAFLYSQDKNKKWLILFFAGVLLGILTKSIQPLLFLPGVALYFFIIGKGKLFFSKSFIVGGLVVFVTVAAYYLTRESMNPGYLQAVWDNELGGRYNSVLEENSGGPLYYISRMEGYLFPYWIWLLPVAIVSGFISKDEKVRQITIYNFIVAASYLVFISLSRTKLYWYTVPLYPLMSLHVGVLFYQAFSYLKKFKWFSRHQVAPLLILSFVFIYPYQKIGRKVYAPQEYQWDNMYPVSELLQDAFHGKYSLHNNVISYTDHAQHFKVYTDALKDKGQQIKYKLPHELLAGDTVIASEHEVFATIESKYKFDLLKNERGVRVYLIK